MRTVLFLSSLWLALLCGPAAATCELRMAWKHDPPFQYLDNQGQLSGLEIEVARAALAPTGCRLHFVELPFARALVELESGHVDLVAGVLPEPGRERYARFSRPGTPSRNLVFLRGDLEPDQAVNTLDELRASSLGIGVERGVAYRGTLELLLARPGELRRVEESTSLEGLLQMAERHRIDAFVADEYSTAFVARELHLKPRPTGIVINADAPVFAFSRRSVDASVVERFDAGLDALRRDGRLRQLETRFLTAPPPPLQR